MMLALLVASLAAVGGEAVSLAGASVATQYATRSEVARETSAAPVSSLEADAEAAETKAVAAEAAAASAEAAAAGAEVAAADAQEAAFEGSDEQAAFRAIEKEEERRRGPVLRMHIHPPA